MERGKSFRQSEAFHLMDWGDVFHCICGYQGFFRDGIHRTDCIRPNRVIGHQSGLSLLLGRPYDYTACDGFSIADTKANREPHSEYSNGESAHRAIDILFGPVEIWAYYYWYTAMEIGFHLLIVLHAIKWPKASLGFLEVTI
jgi:hypothetical protein